MNLNVIPKLIKVSNDIIIMEYIDGDCLDNLDISEYKKSKIIYLLYLFVRNNIFNGINENDMLTETAKNGILKRLGIKKYHEIDKNYKLALWNGDYFDRVKSFIKDFVEINNL